MKSFLLIALLLPPFAVHAENAPNDEAFFQMMRQKAEAAQMEEEFKNPLKVDVGKGRATQGRKGNPVTIIEFSDFQCPYCKRGWETVNQLKEKYKGKYFFAFKHLPLPFHPMAMPAAKRFEAIAIQSADKAYQFHDEIFKNQESLSEAFMDETAKKLKVDIAKMKKDMEGEMVKKRIQDDMDQAKKYNISGTPGFVVMGVTLRGAYPLESFENIISRRMGSEKKD